MSNDVAHAALLDRSSWRALATEAAKARHFVAFLIPSPFGITRQGRWGNRAWHIDAVPVPDRALLPWCADLAGVLEHLAWERFGADLAKIKDDHERIRAHQEFQEVLRSIQKLGDSQTALSVIAWAAAFIDREQLLGEETQS